MNNAEPKHNVFNLIILDESGSMESIKNATISGFNEVVQTVKGVEQQFPEQEHVHAGATGACLRVRAEAVHDLLRQIDLMVQQPVVRLR